MWPLLLAIILTRLCAGVNGPPSFVKNVHIIFSSHLDIGFTDLVPNVINLYVNTYFPRAVATANAVDGMNITANGRIYPLSFRYMTHSWLVSLATDCPLNNPNITCPSPTNLKLLHQGITKGIIYWHAFPFNSQNEFYNADAFESGLRLSQNLSQTFDVKSSTVLSQRDVPGITAGIIPSLLRYNVTGVTVGCNPAATPPHVPNIFRWQWNGDEILGMLHPKGYAHQMQKGDRVGIGYSDCIVINEFEDALCMYFINDNGGPENSKQVISIFTDAAKLFPNATKIFPSTWTDFQDAVRSDSKTYKNLPIVSSDLSDTWVYGIPSDPYKVAAVRMFQREYRNCRQNMKACDVTELDLNRMARMLVKGGEHTWGGDVKTFLDARSPSGPYYAWSNKAFFKEGRVNEPEVQRLIASWLDQKNFVINMSLNSIPKTSSFRTKLETNLNDIAFPALPDVSNMINLTNKLDNTFSFNNIVNFSFGSHGEISKMILLKNQRQIADGTHVLGKFIYQTYGEDNFTDFIKEYAIISAGWVPLDYGKQNLTQYADPEVMNVSPSIMQLYFDGKSKYITKSGWNYDTTKWLQQYYGAPQVVWNIWDFQSMRADSASVDLTVYWESKTPTRIPEAIWVEFSTQGIDDVHISKVNSLVSPKQVVQGGSPHLHGTGDFVVLNDEKGNVLLNVTTLDAGIVGLIPQNMNQFTPFPTPFGVPNVEKGIGINLCNNIWGTNYIMWYPYDVYGHNAKFNFHLEF